MDQPDTDNITPQEPSPEDGSVPEAIGPWLRLDSTPVYDNPWIRVHHENVKTPAGTDGIYGRIHFKNRAVGVVPLDEAGNTWLVRQFRYCLGHYTWEIPEGGVPEGESMLAAGQRELEEETGLTAARWTSIMTLHLSNSVTDEVAEVFLAQDLGQGTMAPEPTEDIEVLQLPFDDALEMALDGRITDAISVAALLKVSRLLAATTSD